MQQKAAFLLTFDGRLFFAVSAPMTGPPITFDYGENGNGGRWSAAVPWSTISLIQEVEKGPKAEIRPAPQTGAKEMM